MRKILKLLIYVMLVVGTPASTYALEQDSDEYEPYYDSQANLKFIRAFNDWAVYKKIEKYKTTCYALTPSYRSKSYNGIRDLPFLAVAYKGSRQYSFTIQPGYEINREYGMILKTNGKNFRLNVLRPGYGFTYSSVQDKTLINNILQDGRTLSIRSYDLQANTSLDFYSLRGFSAAMRFLERNCE